MDSGKLVAATVLWKRVALILVVAAMTVAVLGYFMFYHVSDVSIAEIVSNPQSFDGAHVRLRGYVLDTSVYMFGPRYMLRDFDNEVGIALGGKGGPRNVDLEPYVSFVFDGSNCTQIRNISVSVVGYVRYLGDVSDIPPFYLDVERVEPPTGILEIL